MNPFNSSKSTLQASRSTSSATIHPYDHGRPSYDEFALSHIRRSLLSMNSQSDNLGLITDLDSSIRFTFSSPPTLTGMHPLLDRSSYQRFDHAVEELAEEMEMAEAGQRPAARTSPGFLSTGHRAYLLGAESCVVLHKSAIHRSLRHPNPTLNPAVKVKVKRPRVFFAPADSFVAELTLSSCPCLLFLSSAFTLSIRYCPCLPLDPPLLSSASPMEYNLWPNSYLTSQEDESEFIDGNDYRLDLGSGALESGCPTPTPVPRGTSQPHSGIRRPIARRPSSRSKQAAREATLRISSREKEAERDCGICFEPATNPTRTSCCGHLFCAEHIVSWLNHPASDGRCPSCLTLTSSNTVLPLGHPATNAQFALGITIPTTLRAPPPSRSCSPSPSLSSPLSASPSISSSAAESSDEYSDSSPLSPSSDEESEDSTDYSLPALLRARALQSRRHVAHPLGTVLGARAAGVRLLRLGVWLGVVVVLAGRGRWGGGV
ncbi:hypothetical protein R3P38DRAFT_3283548 [Favolaschia claudopus]|uniref:RING-type E3 ubiquitin transferase n=1 Tax=Favolaschia claudopus TaxID=2862362 RepID=A0AAW0A6C7_9AGAR